MPPIIYSLVAAVVQNLLVPYLVRLIKYIILKHINKSDKFSSEHKQIIIKLLDQNINEEEIGKTVDNQLIKRLKRKK